MADTSAVYEHLLSLMVLVLLMPGLLFDIRFVKSHTLSGLASLKTCPQLCFSRYSISILSFITVFYRHDFADQRRVSLATAERG